MCSKLRQILAHWAKASLQWIFQSCVVSHIEFGQCVCEKCYVLNKKCSFAMLFAQYASWKSIAKNCINPIPHQQQSITEHYRLVEKFQTIGSLLNIKKIWQLLLLLLPQLYNSVWVLACSIILSMVSFPVPSVSNYLLPSSSNRLMLSSHLNLGLPFGLVVCGFHL